MSGADSLRDQDMLRRQEQVNKEGQVCAVKEILDRAIIGSQGNSTTDITINA